MKRFGQTDEVKRELRSIMKKHRIDEPRAFLLWFLKAHFYVSDADLKAAMCDAKNDKTMDAIYVDSHYKIVYVIQSKYKLNWYEPRFKLEDLKIFTHVSRYFESEDKKNIIYLNANEAARAKLHDAYERVRQGFSLRLVFVTNRPNNDTAMQELMSVEELDPMEFRVFDRARVLALHDKYVRGFVPLIPHERIRVVPGENFPRPDKTLPDVQAYVFTVRTKEIARLYRDHREKIFEQNVREFLKSTKVNSAIRWTLDHDNEAPWFWYYHNGITFLADEAKLVSDERGTGVEVENPQIVNGLQSTRVIASSRATNAEVLCRLIVLRQTEDNYETLQKIIKATNSQNPVSQADLMSNDDRQVRLQRALEDFGYFYERKQNEWGNSPKTMVEKQGYLDVFDKVTLARIMIATRSDHDPADAKRGKDKLFSPPLYNDAFSPKFSVDDYLFRWYLYKACKDRSWHDRVAKQALLHVLAVLFRLLSGFDRVPKLRRAFIKLNEQKGEPPKEINRVLKDLFKIARSLLRQEAKLDPDIDANYLFKTPGSETKMLQLLRSTRRTKQRINGNVKALRKILSSFE